MIPQDYITAWSRVAPWASQRQVEQDLIISRAHGLEDLYVEPGAAPKKTRGRKKAGGEE